MSKNIDAKATEVFECAYEEYECDYMDKTLWCNCRESGHRTCDCGRYVYTHQFCQYYQKGKSRGKWVISEDELDEAKKFVDKHRVVKTPLRNCDVGTAEEQHARHYAWCRKHGIDGDNKVNCAHPDMSCDLCALRWAQMLYEEEAPEVGTLEEEP